MYQVELYLRVRRACMVDGMSTREASRVFGLHRDPVRKMLAYAVPPGYRRRQPPRRPRIRPPLTILVVFSGYQQIGSSKVSLGPTVALRGT